MKLRVLFLLLMSCLLFACDTPDEIEYTGNSNGNGANPSDGKDPSQPDDEKPEPPDDKNPEKVSIAYLKSLYRSAPVLIDREIFIEGRIISTDQYGGFYRRIVVEDNTGGIEIRVDLQDYHRSYPYRCIFKVACNSLTISDYGGQLQLGMGERGYIPDVHLSMFLMRVGTVSEFLPMTLTIDEIKAEHISRWVCFNDVQFEQQGAWYGPEDRYIVDSEGRRLLVHTPQQTKFAEYMLPVGSGLIEGVLGVFNGTYQLEVWNDRFAIMEEERFEPRT